ncbi:hypothetical protein [Methylocaldum szegediense]|nr:hypothetical protein [Methylocaldum szegediense]
MKSELNDKNPMAGNSFPIRPLCDLAVFPWMVVNLFCRIGAKVVGF